MHIATTENIDPLFSPGSYQQVGVGQIASAEIPADGFFVISSGSMYLITSLVILRVASASSHLEE